MSAPACAYCGDPAEFQRIGGGGYAFCHVCSGLGIHGIVPESTQHIQLRPYSCTVCGKRTASNIACARPSCAAKEIA